MTGGILLAIGGVWLGCQVLGGDALGRLGITGGDTSGGSSSPAAAVASDAASAASSAVSSTANAITGTQATITKPPMHLVSG